MLSRACSHGCALTDVSLEDMLTRPCSHGRALTEVLSRKCSRGRALTDVLSRIRLSEIYPAKPLDAKYMFICRAIFFCWRFVVLDCFWLKNGHKHGRALTNVLSRTCSRKHVRNSNPKWACLTTPFSANHMFTPWGIFFCYRFPVLECISLKFS